MTRALLLTTVCSALALGGCIDIDFDPPSIVKTKRFLAISADPPEAGFGQDIAFDALLLDENGDNLTERDGVSLHWSICLSLASVFDAAGLGASTELEDDCGSGGQDRIALETEGLGPTQARLSGASLLALAMSLPMEGTMMPPVPGIDQETINTLVSVIAIVGVPLYVDVEAIENGEVVASGYKRFAITTRADPTTNPPPPRFSVGGQWVSARDGTDPHACVSEDGSSIIVPANTPTPLQPEDTEVEWMEDYPVFNLSGDLQTNTESAFYNWFSTGGSFGREITQHPDDVTTWTTPAEAGRYPIWVVVRDGHLGTSWCRAEVEVTN